MTRKRLLDIVAAMAGKRIAVFGDLVVDKFIYGTPKRISREAPVLILQHREERRVPGGGANSAHNIHALGGIPLPVGVVGDDAEGNFLTGFFEGLGIDVSGIHRQPRYMTPTKVRILGGGLHGVRQQIVRLDIEPAAAERELANSGDWIAPAFAERLERAHGGVISDYGYGLVTPARVAAVLAGQTGHEPARRPLVLDSRYRLAEYSGIAAATPNEEEAELAAGIQWGDSLERLTQAGAALLARLAAEAVLVTRGSRGMALFTRDLPAALIPVYGTDQVADVTGAGDTVISAFALALAAGGTYLEAAMISNYAGGIVVMKMGTATVGNGELAETIARDAVWKDEPTTPDLDDPPAQEDAPTVH